MKISTIAFCMLFSFCTPLSQKRLTCRNAPTWGRRRCGKSSTIILAATTNDEADSVTFHPPVPENL